MMVVNSGCIKFCSSLHYHPFAVVIYGLAMFILIFAFSPPQLVMLLLLFVVLFLTEGILQDWSDGLGGVVKLSVFFFLLSIIFSTGVAANPLLFSLTFANIQAIRVSEMTLSIGLANALRLILVYTLFVFLGREIDRDRFLEESARYFPSLALVFSILLLMIPRFVERVKEFSSELALRGHHTSSNSSLRKFTQLRPLVLALTHEALDEAWTLTEVLYGRCYGTGPRTTLLGPSANRPSWSVIGGNVLCICGILSATSEGPLSGVSMIYIAGSLILFHLPHFLGHSYFREDRL